ncbi:hypothetical protein [Emticicia sp. C21]|uniref:hypothetical protein n=1 Tax=Emticicia sp. C21 TaxID=2302915 RepID=UPI0011C15F90|nr:hypothetical protein [Emticicia sp. C21]
MSQCTKVTVGTVKRTTFVNDSAVKTVYFDIEYNGEKLTIDDDYGGKMKNKGERYFIVLSCTRPNFSEAYWDIPVPDTLKFIPQNGWDKIPYNLEKIK